MSYPLIGEGDTSKTVRATFLETFNSDGSAWVTMKVAIPGSDGLEANFEIDFDNPEQVESCMWQMQQYLRNRSIFRSPDGSPSRPTSPSGYQSEPSQAAEDPIQYGDNISEGLKSKLDGLLKG